MGSRLIHRTWMVRNMHIQQQMTLFFVVLLLVPSVAFCTNESDVVVVGGTPGGIASALAAAAAGRSVTLVEYNNHVGGMMTSGLGKSDIENRAMICGLFAEFIGNVREHYVKMYGADHENVKLCRDGYYFEPSVAELVFERMLRAAPNIRVMKGWRLTKAETADGQLTKITIANRKTGDTRELSGGIFIDATYEGDLYAAAGAEYRLGRESRAEYDEPHAGVIYFDYQKKKFLDGTTGEADKRLPAYTYRLCLTTDPDNAHRLTEAPPDYDRKNYVGYFDDLKAGRLAGPKTLKPGRGYNPAHFDTLVRALSVTVIPNRKTDVNINPRPLGFPFVEENRGYVEGDEQTRQRIRQWHRNLTLGLLWFLQNDPEVPQAHRKLANEMHLPKDEFGENGHFPFQLYVREARRLVGEYTLTEHDITGDGDEARKTPRRHVDCIAIGEFPIDSFPCHKRQPSDTIVLEGYLGMLDHITRPYEIPYRIMIPEKLDGVIVPVAASTTHVGFSSIRMEPTWMALGQAAGVAAHLSIEHDVAPRDVPIAKLQQSLRKQGQVLEHAPRDNRRSGKRDYGEKGKPVEILNLPKSGTDPTKIDYATLPVLKGEHVVISQATRNRQGMNKDNPLPTDMRFELHNYLAHHDGRFWCIWSDGPKVEDWPTQEVRFAVSEDGLHWQPSGSVTGTPKEPYAFIARGLWVRDGELLALAAHYKGKGAFGVDKELELWAYAWDGKTNRWRFKQKVYDNAINNFPPQKLSTSEWILTRRDARFNVSVLIGGVKSLDDWRVFPVVKVGEVKGFRPDEPIFWPLPDDSLFALYRDNGGSRRLFHSPSLDAGRTWGKPVITNFPNATSKLFSMQTSSGVRVLALNANPNVGRRELHLAASRDGRKFTRLARLGIPAPPTHKAIDSPGMRNRFRSGVASLQYPHIIEHDGGLYIALSRNKLQTELLRVPVAEIDALLTNQTNK